MSSGSNLAQISVENPLSMNGTIEDGSLMDMGLTDDGDILNNHTLEVISCVMFHSTYPDAKWWIVALCGTSTCVLSLVTNALLLAVFNTHKQLKRSHFYYMHWLCVADIFMACSYILLMSVMTFMQYYELHLLYEVWFLYVRPMFAICQVVITTSAFLIVAATAERYCRLVACLMPVYRAMCSGRLFVVISAIVIGVLTRGTIFFEIAVTVQPNCSGMARLMLHQSELMNDVTYTQLMFAIRSLICVLLPFITLVFCNSHIVVILLLQHFQVTKHKQNMSPAAVTENPTSKQKSSFLDTLKAQQIQMDLSSATIMLVLVVCSYLIANCLNIVITVWEFVHMRSLLERDFFYTLSADIVSVLTIVAGALRLPIYCCGNTAIRHATRRLVGDWLLCGLCVCWTDERVHTRHAASEQMRSYWTEQWTRVWHYTAVNMNEELRSDPDPLQVSFPVMGRKRMDFEVVTEGNQEDEDSDVAL